MGSPLRIGSRGSDLALWQARYIAERIGDEVEMVVIKTEGDRIQHLSLDKVEGKGFFTKEIEEALLAGGIDVAVHSYKDLPIGGPEGLLIAAVPERGPVRDVVVRKRTPHSELAWGLARGARVGTSSLRRKAQLRAHRPDLVLVDVRGNVPTRVAKVARGELDAAVLAEAGIQRLGLEAQLERDGLLLEPLDVADVCPAPAQGALAVQIREGDARARYCVHALHHAPTAEAVAAERALLSRFGGGCHLPLGALAELRAGGIELRAVVAAPDGSALLQAQAFARDAATAVALVYTDLVEQGVERYLNAATQDQPKETSR